MKLLNSEIVGFNKKFNEVFDNNTQYLPAKVNFAIHKNEELIVNASKAIDKSRMDIYNHYGEYNQEENKFFFSNDVISQANSEIEDLLSIEQDLPICMIPLSSLDNIDFTPNQMQAILFMIDGDN